MIVGIFLVFSGTEMNNSETLQNHDYLFRNALRSPIGRVGSTGLLINSSGVSDSPMRILGSYALVYLWEGNGFFRDENGFASQVVAGDLMIIFPDVAHAYGPTPGHYWNEFHTIFEGEVFDLWRYSGLLDETAPILHLEPVEWWRKRLMALRDWAQSPHGNDAQNSLRQLCTLQQILADALATRHEITTSNERDWLENARHVLAQATSSTRLNDAAREMGISYKSVRKKFT